MSFRHFHETLRIFRDRLKTFNTFVKFLEISYANSLDHPDLYTKKILSTIGILQFRKGINLMKTLHKIHYTL